MRMVCLLKWFYGVTAAQEILVLLEIVRVSLELLQFFHLCASACESSSALFIIHFFKCFFYLNNLFFFSTACDKSLSLPLKQFGNALHTQI